MTSPGSSLTSMTTSTSIPRNKMRRPRPSKSTRCNFNCRRIRRRDSTPRHPFHALLLLCHLLPPPTSSTQSSPHPYRLTLPDSTQSPPISLVGSPAYSQTVDDAGYTVLVDPKDGYVRYAAVNAEGELIPTKFKILKEEGGTLDPGEVYDLEPRVEPGWYAKQKDCGRYCLDEWEAYEWNEMEQNDDDGGGGGGCDLFCSEGGIVRRLRDTFVGALNTWLSYLGGVANENGIASPSVVDNNDNNKRIDFNPSAQNKEPTSRKLQPPNKLINLVIPIRFANHVSRPSIPTSDLSILFNSPDPVQNLAPTGSIRQYFAVNSYGRLLVESVVVNWIRVANTEQYYAGRKSGMSETFHSSLVEALNKLDADPSFDFKEYDRDGDGVVDSVFFLHSGYGAEWGGVDCVNGNDRSNRIWSHKWKIVGGGGVGNTNTDGDNTMGWVSKSGVRVDDYAVSSAYYGVCGKFIARIGTIAHEMGRLFGLPSLYGGDAPNGGNGIGSFGLMGNSWGWDGSQYYPPLMSPWSKMELGWLEPITILSSGTYSLPPVGSDPKVFRIDLGRDDEFLLLENRAATSFDAKMPKGGLVIYHIDNRAPHYPNDNLIHSTSLGNHAHYRVAVVSADGKFDMEGGMNRGDESDIFGSNHTLGVGFMGEMTIYPNTDSYREGVVKPSGIEIFSISDAQDDPNGHVKFTVMFPGDTIPETAPPSLASTPVPNLQLVQKSLLTTFGANTGSYGVMFDVVAIDSVDITALDLHLRSGIDEGEKLIEVYVMSGTHVGNESSAALWGKVCCSKMVIGNGVAKRTTLDSSNFLRKISLASGERMAFYIASDEPIVRYSSSLKPACCEIFASSLDLQVFEGTGVGSYPFSLFAKPRVFNGAIYYETMENTNQVTLPEQSSLLYSPELVKSATSSFFSGNSGGFGIMFDVIPKKNMVITSLDFHTDLEDIVEVNVWTRKGSHQRYERDQLAWKRICSNVQLTGQGPYKPTPIDKGFLAFELHTYERAAIYVTLSTPNMRYTKLNEGEVGVGDIINDLPDIRVFAGSGIRGFPFGEPISPRLWNGSINYALVAEASDEAQSLSEMVPEDSFGSNSTAETLRLSTTFASGNKGYGSMFDISNTEGDNAVITSIDFHTDLLNDIHVVVYTKEGSFLGSEFKPGDWTVIANTSVAGQGYYKRTSIPKSDFKQVSIPNGSFRGFYVSIDQPNLLYSNVEEDTGVGGIISQSDGIGFHIGSGLQGTFSNVFQPRVHNGGIHYYHKSYDSSTEPASIVPTSSPGGATYQYETPVSGESGSFGIMFSIKNQFSEAISITSLAFHTDLVGECAVEIYTLSGDYTGKEQNSTEWTKISSVSVEAYGLNAWSQVPAFKMQQVEIPADMSQSFYLTLEQPSLKYSLPDKTDSEIETMGDGIIEIYAGSGVGGYPFGLSMSPRQPELRVDYKLETNS